MEKNFEELEEAWDEFTDIYDGLDFEDKEEVDEEYQKVLQTFRDYQSGEISAEEARRTATTLRRLTESYRAGYEKRQELLDNLQFAYDEVLSARDEGKFPNDNYAHRVVVRVSGFLEGYRDNTLKGLDRYEAKNGLEFALDVLRELNKQ